MSTVSIIIPTHNRKDSLLRTLTALRTQSFPSHQLEVIVVADGCTDATPELLAGFTAPFELRVIEQPAGGAASARNKGAAAANGSILLFLDDDIEASPLLVQAHVEAHHLQRNKVVIGYVPPVLKTQKGFFKIKLREWWENMFYTISQKGHQFHYRNLLSGNFSLHAALFEHIGGFDTAFKCQEDYEIGLRLIKSDADFTYASKALGYHHEETQLKRSLSRKYEEGKAAVLFIRKYPDLLYTLPLLSHFAHGFPAYYHKLLNLIFGYRPVADLRAGAYLRWLGVLEWLRMRKSWQNLLDKLLAYWYLRGVADMAGSMKELEILLKNRHSDGMERNELEISVDIKAGIPEAEKEIDAIRPTSIRIVYGNQPIGYIADKIGYERLRGAHLRPVLANTCTDTLMHVLALSDAADDPGSTEQYTSGRINELLK